MESEINQNIFLQCGLFLQAFPFFSLGSYILFVLTFLLFLITFRQIKTDGLASFGFFFISNICLWRFERFY